MRRAGRSLKRSSRADTLPQGSHEGTLAYRLAPASNPGTPNLTGTCRHSRRKMAKFLLIAFAALAVILVGGAGVLMFWDVPAPSAPVEHVIPDARLAK